MMKLNVGCGTDIRKGWINMDLASLEGVDVVHDINNLPLPFDFCMFDEIVCQDILEHIEYIPVLKELHRILKVGGVLSIRVPHFSSRNNYIDPTHKKMFSIRTFDFFAETSFLERGYYFDFKFSKIVDRKIVFQKKILFYNYLIEPLINIHPRVMDLYESTMLARIFPAENIKIFLIK